MSVRFTCINKSGGNHADPHHAIEYLGWTNGVAQEGPRLGIEAVSETWNRMDVVWKKL
jgi:hypothetical protein